MIVEFNVKKLFGKIPVSPKLKQCYELIIQYICEKEFAFIDTAKVEKVIIPDDFLTEVVDYQSFLGMDNPSVTRNEFGRAYGKMLHDTNQNKYYVFIDGDMASILMNDPLFSNCFGRLDEKTQKLVELERQRALNLLAHELAHVEFHEHITLPEASQEYDSQIESLLYQLFDEYYACRRSAVVSSEGFISYDEKYIADIEQKIINEKWNYKTHAMSLTEFCKLFHSYTKQSLIGMVSALGSLADKQLPDSLYGNCKVGIIIDDFKSAFEKMYDNFIKEKSMSIPRSLVANIERYYDSFGVYISRHPKGLYYDIPD